MPEMTPRAFSFNSPHGACQECQGLGAVYDFDPARLVPDESLSLAGRRDRAVGEGRREARQARRSRTLGKALRHRPRRCRSAGCRRSMRDLLFFGAPGGARRAESGRRPRKKAEEGRDAEGSVRRRLRGPDPQPAPPLRGGHAGSSRRTSSRTARCGRARPATASACKAQSRAVASRGGRSPSTSNLPISEALQVVRRARADAIARR